MTKGVQDKSTYRVFLAAGGEVRGEESARLLRRVVGAIVKKKEERWMRLYGQ